MTLFEITKKTQQKEFDYVIVALTKLRELRAQQQLQRSKQMDKTP